MKKLFTLFYLAALAITMNAGEITVAEGTATSDEVPVYSYYGDTQTHNQIIYPASYLTDLKGTSISAMTFYVSSKASAANTPVYNISLAIVEDDHFTASWSSEYSFNTTDLTKVYEGTFDASQATVTITFTTPFAYAEGNLMLDIQTKTKGNDKDASFKGISTTNTQALRGTTIIAGRSFLPQTTFTFSGGSATTCVRPSQLAAATTPDGAVFTWSGDNEAQYQWCIVAKDAEPAGWATLAAGVLTYTATGLTAGTEYDFYVRTYCSETSQSESVKTTFSPTCNAPTSLTVTGITNHAATLAWSAAAGIDKYQYVCLRKDSTPVWDDVEAQAGLTVTLDTLAAQTSYDFYVRSYYSAGVQSSATKISFTTECDVMTMPWSENFNSETLSSCWTIANRSSYGWQKYNYSDETGSFCVRFNAGGFAGYVDTLLSPIINLSEEAILKCKIKNNYNLSVKLYISTNGAAFAELADFTNPKSDVVDLSAYSGDIQLMLLGTTANMNRYFYLDDVQVVAKPCDAPSDVAVSVAVNSAVVTWTAGGGEDTWNLRYRVKDTDAWTEIKNLDEPTDTLSELTTGTAYEVQVQAACSAEKQSEWTASVDFTPACPVPTDVAVSAISYDHATVTWSSMEEEFNLQYREADADGWTTIEDIAAYTYRLTSLQASTTYQVRVQAACGGEFSAAKSFTTGCAPLVDTIPFVEVFDSVPDYALPACWNRLSATDYPYVLSGTAAYGEEGSCLWFGGEEQQLVVLPIFDADLRKLTLSFYYKVNFASLQVGYLSELDTATFVSLADLEAISSYGSEPYALNLQNAAESAYLAIRFFGATSTYASAQVDNVRLEETSATAIDSVTGNPSPVTLKLIRDGQLLIEHSGILYNAQGQKL